MDLTGLLDSFRAVATPGLPMAFFSMATMHASDRKPLHELSVASGLSDGLFHDPKIDKHPCL